MASRKEQRKKTTDRRNSIRTRVPSAGPPGRDQTARQCTKVLVPHIVVCNVCNGEGRGTFFFFLLMHTTHTARCTCGRATRRWPTSQKNRTRDCDALALLYKHRRRLGARLSVLSAFFFIQIVTANSFAIKILLEKHAIAYISNLAAAHEERHTIRVTRAAMFRLCAIWPTDDSV